MRRLQIELGSLSIELCRRLAWQLIFENEFIKCGSIRTFMSNLVPLAFIITEIYKFKRTDIAQLSRVYRLGSSPPSSVCSTQSYTVYPFLKG